MPIRFRKEIHLHDRDVIELFDVGWYVLYDVMIPGASTVWRINKEDYDKYNFC